MEYWITWGGDPEDVCFTTRGVASVLDVGVMMHEAFADARWCEGLKVLFDHTQTDWEALPVDDWAELAQLLKDLDQEFGQQRIAAAFGDPASFHSARLVGLMLDREVTWVGHLFGSLADARQWLRELSDQNLPHILPRW